MPRATMSQVSSRVVAYEKFFLRQLITFFMKKRKKVFGDSDFEFTVEELKKYLKKTKPIMAGEADRNLIAEHLKFMRQIYKRDDNLDIIQPRQTLIKFESADDGFLIKEGYTEHLRTALKSLDISIYLKERPELYKDRSLFSLTNSSKIIFLDYVPENALGLKERAIFNTLRNNFNNYIDYHLLFNAVKNLNNAEIGNVIFGYDAQQKKKYINNGVTELRKKLYQISGNPDTIITSDEEVSSYRLIY